MNAICHTCGEPFQARTDSLKRNRFSYCSRKCYGGQVVIICDECGASHRRPRSEYSEGRHHFCGAACRAKWVGRHNSEAARNRDKAPVLDQGYPCLAINRLSEDRLALARQMVKRGHFIREHRLLMAEAIGRPLLRGEVVHHVNGIRHDNRLSNLKLLSGPGEHRSIHAESKR